MLGFEYLGNLESYCFEKYDISNFQSICDVTDDVTQM